MLIVQFFLYLLLLKIKKRRNIWKTIRAVETGLYTIYLMFKLLTYQIKNYHNNKNNNKEKSIKIVVCYDDIEFI